MRFVLFGAVVFLSACENKEPASTCDLSLEGLDGQSFVMLEAMADKSTRKNPIARVKFSGTGDEMKAKYTVMSLSDVYDYDCKIREVKKKGGKKGEVQEELYCRQPEDPVRYCEALLAGGDMICTKKRLKKVLQEEHTDEELNKIIIEAKKKFNAMEKKGGFAWKQYRAFNNSLLNKLQGRLYITVDERRCRLSLGDFYFTIINGKGAEDSNPVGQNPFGKADKEYLFEHCDDGRNFAPWKSATLPEDMSKVGVQKKYKINSDVYFHYLRTDPPVEGCTYEAELYSSLKAAPVATVPITVDAEKKEINWVIKHSFTKDDVLGYGQDKSLGLLHAKRFKTCGGKREKIDMVCGVALLGM